MHELSMASAIVEAVLQEIKRQKLPPVQAIALRVGALSAVDPEALRFSFEVITADTALAKTELRIEPVPVQGKCRACSHEFTVQDFIFTCPLCQSGQIEVTGGDELDIAYLEVESNAGAGEKIHSYQLNENTNG
jgi:hydrogenase nickel incorporation protein HypA/HybF